MAVTSGGYEEAGSHDQMVRLAETWQPNTETQKKSTLAPPREATPTAPNSSFHFDGGTCCIKHERVEEVRLEPQALLENRFDPEQGPVSGRREQTSLLIGCYIKQHNLADVPSRCDLQPPACCRRKPQLRIHRKAQNWLRSAASRIQNPESLLCLELLQTDSSSSPPPSCHFPSSDRRADIPSGKRESARRVQEQQEYFHLADFPVEVKCSPQLRLCVRMERNHQHVTDDRAQLLRQKQNPQLPACLLPNYAHDNPQS